MSLPAADMDGLWLTMRTRSNIAILPRETAMAESVGHSLNVKYHTATRITSSFLS
jgi:hypothetical protein